MLKTLPQTYIMRNNMKNPGKKSGVNVIGAIAHVRFNFLSFSNQAYSGSFFARNNMNGLTIKKLTGTKAGKLRLITRSVIFPGARNSVWKKTKKTVARIQKNRTVPVNMTYPGLVNVSEKVGEPYFLTSSTAPVMPIRRYVNMHAASIVKRIVVFIMFDLFISNSITIRVCSQ